MIFAVLPHFLFMVVVEDEVKSTILMGVNVTINRVGDDKNSNFTAEIMTIWCVAKRNRIHASEKR